MYKPRASITNALRFILQESRPTMATPQFLLLAPVHGLYPHAEVSDLGTRGCSSPNLDINNMAEGPGLDYRYFRRRSHVACRMSHVACRISHDACSMSHVACRMLHVACSERCARAGARVRIRSTSRTAGRRTSKAVRACRMSNSTKRKSARFFTIM